MIKNDKKAIKQTNKQINEWMRFHQVITFLKVAVNKVNLTSYSSKFDKG